MTTTQRAAPGPAAHAQRRGAGAWRAARARGPLPAAATSAPSPPHRFSPRPALALAAPFGTHRSYPSSHITSSATPAKAPGDAPLTRARRAAEQAAPRRASAGSTSGASQFRLGDTEGHGGARRGTGTAAGHRPFSRDPTGQTAQEATLAHLAHTDCHPRRHPRRHPWVTLCHPRRHPRVSTDG